MYTVPSGMRWLTIARAATTPLRLVSSIQSLSAIPTLAASRSESHTDCPPRERLSMNRLSWYSEWMDHLLCGVRYRTETPCSFFSPMAVSPNSDVMISCGLITDCDYTYVCIQTLQRMWGSLLGIE